MDFFAAQESARRHTRWLLAWYAVAVAAVVASFCAAGALVYALFAGFWGLESPWLPWRGHLAIAAAVGGSILSVSAYRMWQLSEGGEAVAELLGARRVAPGACSAVERRLLNVVEEMAIASGIAVPAVYVLDREQGINALVAGFTPNEAVIIVTVGALERLSRDELQGMMGHEFSHILNGDMALNVRLAGVLRGLTWLRELGEAMVYGGAREARAAPEDGSGAITALAGALIAFIGFPGTLAADAIKAAISREREYLADAAAVQFTRNPECIAGALDSILATHSTTRVLAANAGLFSHLFFATAVSRWWGFPTHPPIEARIRRVDPHFLRENYREVHHGAHREVAVLDGAGNVVKNLRQGPAPGPTPQHIDYAARLLAGLPARLREALRGAEEAEAAMFALALERDEAARRAELASLRQRRGEPGVEKVAALIPYVDGVARNCLLTLAKLAVSAIREQPQAARDAFLADLGALVGADGRVTLREFVLFTFLRQRLRAGAGQPIPARYGRIEEVAPDAQAVLSLVAHAAGAASCEQAFEKGAAALGLGWKAPLGLAELDCRRVGEALERVRALAPFAKPALLKACLEAATADGVLHLAEAELVRTVAATLDCPMPPLLEARDPRTLAA